MTEYTDADTARVAEALDGVWADAFVKLYIAEDREHEAAEQIAAQSGARSRVLGSPSSGMVR